MMRDMDKRSVNGFGSLKFKLKLLPHGFIEITLVLVPAVTIDHQERTLTEPLQGSFRIGGAIKYVKLR